METIEPPRVSASLVVGLLEAVDESGGTEDVAQIARDGRLHADVIPELLIAAKTMNLVHVDGGEVSLTDLGRRLLAAKARDRKRIVAESLRQMPPMQDLTDLLRSKGGSASVEAVLGHLAEKHGSVRAAELFRSLVYWGRYAQLVRYDNDSRMVSLASRG